MKRFAALSFCLMLAACATDGAPTEEAGAEKAVFRKTSFSAIPGWAADDVAAVLPALQKSCARIAKRPATASFGIDGAFSAGNHGDWQAACRDLPADPAQARSFFETRFTPYEIHGTKREGLFTGYYEPSLTSSAGAAVPLYARPKDLVTVNLGDFRPELKGETVMGRVDGQKLVPYYTRAEIDAGALKGKAETVALVDDPVDAFFLQVQGSGQVTKADGSVLHVGYDSQNGQKYEAIGKALIARGALTKENVSMQTIRAWLDANPSEAPALMATNKSYVFFREIGAEGPLGAEGVPLTPGRSLAVDRRKFAYGAPVFVDAAAPEAAGEDKGPRFQRLMIAQDTGGAIRGAVRGDVFWGAGDQAAATAGVMKSPGYAYILVPNNVVLGN